MKLWMIPFVAAVVAKTDGVRIAEMVSNYAKVSVNKGIPAGGNATNSSTTALPFTTTLLTSTPLPSINDTDEEDDPEYDDFDDLQATTERSQTSMNSQTMMTYVNGLVSLLAMMYKFSGTSSSIRPEKLHFGASKPRQANKDDFAHEINNLAEDRFQLTTATKQFKKQKGVYSPIPSYPPYDPTSSKSAESYSSNNGKTSYDSDVNQYMVPNPEKPMMNQYLPPNPDKNMMMNDGQMFVQKSPMNDYMSQNDVDIYKSYSYELTEAPTEKPMMDNEMTAYNYMKPEPKEVFINKKKMHKPKPWDSTPFIDDTGDDHHGPSPVYYPSKDKPKKARPAPPPMDDEDDHHDIEESPVYYPWKNGPPPKKSKPAPPPPEEHPEDDDEEHSPVYYPWKSSSPKKKPAPPPEEDHPEDDHHEIEHYYPWISSSSKKKPKPPPEEPEEDDAPPPWASKPSPKGKPPKDEEHDHPPIYYPYYSDHDHGVFDPHHEEHHDEKEHDLKDEDRESKHPYSHYNLGRKLWYVPLLFSLYFIIYIAALILKSVARHKIQLPEKLYELGGDHHGDRRRQSRKIEEVTQRVYDSIDHGKNKFM